MYKSEESQGIGIPGPQTRWENGSIRDKYFLLTFLILEYQNFIE